MRPLVPLAGGFITLQPNVMKPNVNLKLLTFLSSTGVNVFTGAGICKRGRAIEHSKMYYFPMMSSFLAVGVAKRLANQKLGSLIKVCEVKLIGNSSVREAHALKLKIHEQTEIRYNSVPPGPPILI